MQNVTLRQDTINTIARKAMRFSSEILHEVADGMVGVTSGETISTAVTLTETNTTSETQDTAQMSLPIEGLTETQEEKSAHSVSEIKEQVTKKRTRKKTETTTEAQTATETPAPQIRATPTMSNTGLPVGVTDDASGKPVLPTIPETPTAQDVIAACKAMLTGYPREKILGVLKTFGAESVQKLDATKYGEVLKALHAFVATNKAKGEL